MLPPLAGSDAVGSPTRDNIAYIKRHGIHVVVDRLVSRLLQERPPGPQQTREMMLQCLRDEAARRAAGTGSTGSTGNTGGTGSSAVVPAAVPPAPPSAAAAPTPAAPAADAGVKKRKARQRTQTMLKNEDAKPKVAPAPSAASADRNVPTRNMEEKMAQDRTRTDNRRQAAAAAREAARKGGRAQTVGERNEAEGAISGSRRHSKAGCAGEWDAEWLTKRCCAAILEPAPGKVQFHPLFHHCAVTQRRPAMYLNAWSMLGYSHDEAQKRYRSTKKGKSPEQVWINYDLSVYERAVIVFDDDCENGWKYMDAGETGPVDDFIAALCDSKGTYCEEPVKDKDVSRCAEPLAPLVRGMVHITMQGWRATQEDAHIHIRLGERCAVFAVLDGHGGTCASKWVAGKLPETLAAHGVADASVDEMPAKLRAAMEAADTALEDDSGEECGTVGATCCLIVVTPTHYICANVGDSRGVLCRDGVAVAMSEDHSLDNEEECKRVRAAGYEVRNNRIEGMLSVPRAFGDFDFKQCGGRPASEQAVSVYADVRSFERSPADNFIVLGCDGIWDAYDNEDAVAHVRQSLADGLGDEAAVTRLLDDNLPKEIDEEAIGTDNQTCILITLKDGVPPAAPPAPPAEEVGEVEAGGEDDDAAIVERLVREQLCAFIDGDVDRANAVAHPTQKYTPEMIDKDFIKQYGMFGKEAAVEYVTNTYCKANFGPPHFGAEMCLVKVSNPAAMHGLGMEDYVKCQQDKKSGNKWTVAEWSQDEPEPDSPKPAPPAAAPAVPAAGEVEAGGEDDDAAIVEEMVRKQLCAFIDGDVDGANAVAHPTQRYTPQMIDKDMIKQYGMLGKEATVEYVNDTYLKAPFGPPHFGAEFCLVKVSNPKAMHGLGMEDYVKCQQDKKSGNKWTVAEWGQDEPEPE